MRLLENKVRQMERSYILQTGRQSIMRHMTAHIFSLRFRRFQERNLEVIGMKKVDIRRRVREVLELVSLQDKAKAFPDELSGGQQQRATIGRAIANHPKVLIADEPTGNLDPQMSAEIMDLLEKINEVEHATIVMVTHDSTIVDRFKKRTICLEEGYVIADIMKGGYLKHE